MSGLPQKVHAAGMDGHQEPAEAEEDLIKARALRNVQAMVNDIRFGRTDIEFDARFIDALTQFYQDDVAEEFFETLHGSSEISGVVVEIFSCDTNEDVYARLGRALGTLPALLSLKICLLDGKPAAVALAASMLTHIQQIKIADWYFPQDSVAPAEVISSDADAAFSSLSAAFDGNTSIKYSTLRSNARTDLAAGVCQSMKGLLGLTDTTLSGTFTHDYAVTVEEAISMSELFQAKSLRYLAVNDVSFADIEASLTFSLAIAESSLDALVIQLPRIKRGQEELIPLDLTRALTGSHLRDLVLYDVAFLEYDLAMAFCRALSASQLHTMELHGLQMHADAIYAFGRAICRPGLVHLEVEHVSDSIIDAIGTSLKGAPNLNALQIRTFSWDSPLSESSVVNVLDGCTHCPDLAVLGLGGMESWTVPMDQAAGKCIRHCGKLRTIDIGDLDLLRGNFCPSPAFLAACQAHRVVETIIPPSGCPMLRAALALVTAKNKETREYRSYFDSLAGDHHGRAAFSRAVAKVNDKPHLLFLALTTNKHLF